MSASTSARSDVVQVALRVGDYAAGAATAVATAAPLHALVGPGSDMVLAILLGLAVGILAHLVVLALAHPALGFFQVMAPGGMIGMYGGMLFAMRDSVQASSWSRDLGVAVLFGVLVVAALNVYGRLLRARSASDREGTGAR